MRLLILIVVIATSIWVLVDAKTIGVKKGQMKGVANSGPVGWCLGCLLLWIVLFPWYLLKRNEYKRINGKDADSSVVTIFGLLVVLLVVAAMVM